MNEQELRTELARAAFVADELRLFLDTHPLNRQALEHYRTAAETAQTLKQQLGVAVNAMDAGKNGRWDWTATPWPWQQTEG